MEMGIDASHFTVSLIQKDDPTKLNGSINRNNHGRLKRKPKHCIVLFILHALSIN